MKLRFTNDWKTYYPCFCSHCLWAGSSQDVFPQESYEYDGPFYCPFCMKMDPTFPDIEMGQYYVRRIFSLLTQPLRFIVRAVEMYKIHKWIERDNAIIDKKMR